jgi:very-short-patch-repair endonuclease
VKVEGYRVDFALTDVPGVPLLNVVIELDGHDYHSTQVQRNNDTARDRRLMRAGWQVVRFTGSQINRDCAGCVRETVALVKEWRKWLS